MKRTPPKRKPRESEDSLVREYNSVRAKLDVIRAKRECAENRKLLGKCFRYRNTYGSDAGWWLYSKVTGASRGLRAFTFEECVNGIVTIRRDHCFTRGSHEPIPESEFQLQWMNLAAKISKLRP